MAKDFEFSGDITQDIKPDACDKNLDLNNDLARDNGVDLNNVDNETVSKNKITNVFAGAMAGMAGISGLYAPNDHVQEIMNEPRYGFHQEYERPNLNPEYDDGKFDPNQQREAEEINTSLNEPIPAEHCDPPQIDTVEQMSEDTTINENNE